MDALGRPFFIAATGEPVSYTHLDVYKRQVHNPAAHKTVADSLTTTEFAISMLACRGWSNTEIADHMGISRGTVKNRLSTTYAKLGITSRSGLKEFMLK